VDYATLRRNPVGGTIVPIGVRGVTKFMLNLEELEAFLAVADELHFGRAAARLRLSPSRVSRLLSALERRVGGRLLERTSRRVELTDLGRRLTEKLAPAHAALLSAVEQARRESQAAATTGKLRVGYHSFTAEGVFARLSGLFATRHPQCVLTLVEVGVADPFAPLQSGDLDMLVTWRPMEKPAELVVGASIDREPRAIAVGASHPLAKRRTISVEELPDWPVGHMTDRMHPWLHQALVPPTTPAGRPLLLAQEQARSVQDLIHQVSTGRTAIVVVPTMDRYLHDRPITVVGVRDLPPLERVLMWRSSADGPFVRRFAALAEQDLAERAAENDLLADAG
jgi:DNA-binding transcriptional LysR family regulator